MDSAHLARLLRAKTGFEIVDFNPKETQLRILGRLPSTRMGDWLATVHALYSHAEKQSHWTVDISKYYFKRNGKVVYAWRMIFQADSIEMRMDGILAALSVMPTQSVKEIDQFPLVGVGADRNVPKNGKGAGFSREVL